MQVSMRPDCAIRCPGTEEISNDDWRALLEYACDHGRVDIIDEVVRDKNRLARIECFDHILPYLSRKDKPEIVKHVIDRWFPKHGYIPAIKEHTFRECVERFIRIGHACLAAVMIKNTYGLDGSYASFMPTIDEFGCVEVLDAILTSGSDKAIGMCFDMEIKITSGEIIARAIRCNRLKSGTLNNVLVHCVRCAREDLCRKIFAHPKFRASMKLFHALECAMESRQSQLASLVFEHMKPIVKNYRFHFDIMRSTTLNRVVTTMDDIVICAAVHGHVDILEYLHCKPRSIASPDLFLRIVKKYRPDLGVLDCLVRYERVDPGFNSNEAIHLAIERDDHELVDLLINHPRVSLASGYVETLHRAILTDNAWIVQRVLAEPNIDIGLRFPHLVKLLSESCHDDDCCCTLDGLRLVMNDPRVDPSRNLNQAMREAAMKPNIRLVCCLLEDPRTSSCG